MGFSSVIFGKENNGPVFWKKILDIYGMTDVR